MSTLSLSDAILEVLSLGAFEAPLLLEEVRAKRSVPSIFEWRRTLINLESKGTIRRDLIRDEDTNEVIRVIYALPSCSQGRIDEKYVA